MSQQRVRLLHRIAVDWAADTFGLRTPGARTRHENARFRAAGRAGALHGRARERARASARALPARLHAEQAERGEPRVPASWQARIGHLAGHLTGQGDGQRAGQRGGRS